jgi:hypothetical protein
MDGIGGGGLRSFQAPRAQRDGPFSEKSPKIKGGVHCCLMLAVGSLESSTRSQDSLQAVLNEDHSSVAAINDLPSLTPSYPLLLRTSMVDSSLAPPLPGTEAEGRARWPLLGCEMDKLEVTRLGRRDDIGKERSPLVLSGGGR